MSGPALAGHALRLEGARLHVVLGVLPGVMVALLHSAVLDLPRTDFIDALGTDRYRVYWVTGTYLLGSATGMAMVAFFQARVGLRVTFLAALAVFGIASALCGTVSTVLAMAPLRLLAGFAMGLVICAGMLLLWREFPEDEELPMTLYGMGVYLSALLGVACGGFLLHVLDWRAIFLVNIPLTAAALAMGVKYLPERRTQVESRRRFDPVGLAIFSLWVATGIVVLAMGQYWGWLDSPSFIPWGVGLTLSSIAFVAWGTLREQPLIDLRPLAERNFGLGLAVKAIYSINLYVVLALLSQYMLGLRGYQWWQAAWVLMPAALAMVLAMLAGARFGRDRDRKTRIFAGLALMAWITWRISALDLYTSKLWLAGELVFWGLGAGLAIGPIMLAVFSGVSRSSLAHGAGLFNILRALPVFAVGSILLIMLTHRQDGQFDRLRQRITYNRPLLTQTVERIDAHFTARGSGKMLRDQQARALLASWVRANANAFALQDILRVLALVTASSLLLVPLLRAPPAARVET